MTSTADVDTVVEFLARNPTRRYTAAEINTRLRWSTMRTRQALRDAAASGLVSRRQDGAFQVWSIT